MPLVFGRSLIYLRSAEIAETNKRKSYPWLNIALFNSIAFTKYLKSSSFVSDQISRQRERFAFEPQSYNNGLYPLGMIAARTLFDQNANILRIFAHCLHSLSSLLLHSNGRGTSQWSLARNKSSSLLR